jgi:hypothetical protein
MKATFVNQYLSGKHGDPDRRNMFLYYLTGTPVELAAYRAVKEEQGFYATDDKGRPLWHSTSFIGNSRVVSLSPEGYIRSENSLPAKLNSVLSKLPDGPLKDAVAGQAGKMLLDDMLGINVIPATAAAEPAAEPAPEPTESSEQLGHE